jgi:hypothetical protein
MGHNHSPGRMTSRNGRNMHSVKGIWTDRYANVDSGGVHFISHPAVIAPVNTYETWTSCTQP